MLMIEIIIEIVVKSMKSHKRVYPRMIVGDVHYSERHIRRYMVRMAKDGLLVRVGQRGGYTI